MFLSVETIEQDGPLAAGQGGKKEAVASHMLSRWYCTVYQNLMALLFIILTTFTGSPAHLLFLSLS